MTILVDQASALPLGDIVDLERYPLDDPDGPALRDIIEQARADLDGGGCVRLPSFVRPEAHERLSAETQSVAHLAHKVCQWLTPYSDNGKPEWPEDHPQRRADEMTNGFVGKDLIGDDTMIKQLYHDERFQRFVGTCLGLEEIHTFADPIRGLVVNVMEEGEKLPWHYDANEFIVSLMTRPADGGGQFQYFPNLREPGDEHYGDVKRVLDGDLAGMQKLTLEVGDIQLFKGRYSMHRVTPVVGTRHVVLFGYSETPGYIGGVESTRLGYGRVTQAHLDAEAAGQHADGLDG